MTYKVKYIYTADVTGIVAEISSSVGSGLYINEFKLRLSDGELVDVNTPALLGISSGDEVTVKVFTKPKDETSRRYLYIPPESAEEG